ncbi:unnamed protein product [Strongylus vulgaris]|uniref:Moybdenum cofactor oxidoreductase dimerisation domain-containing protein n=1 Tax=Strongylus vulgaris TaxID=40348 RepID=A0A3P7K0G8_STRVU|nr:unnamed protein product [Strongylus vulgaris]
MNGEDLPRDHGYPLRCIAPGEETFEVAGYAWSGGGRGIIRVEVSADGGKTWQCAELEQDEKQDLDHMWAWTLFRANIKIPEKVNKMELVVKATDRYFDKRF